jgi:hypothetical protein
MKLIENVACRFLIYRFKKGYGADCKTSDLDDFKNEHTGVNNGLTRKETVMHPARCASCRAEETIDFLKQHIIL